MIRTMFKANGRMGPKTLALCLPDGMHAAHVPSPVNGRSQFAITWQYQNIQIVFQLVIPDSDWLQFQTVWPESASPIMVQLGDFIVRESLESLLGGKVTFRTAQQTRFTAALDIEGLVELSIGSEDPIEILIDTLLNVKSSIRRDELYPLVVDGSRHLLSLLLSRDGRHYLFVFTHPNQVQYAVEVVQFQTLLHVLTMLWERKVSE